MTEKFFTYKGLQIRYLEAIASSCHEEGRGSQMSADFGDRPCDETNRPLLVMLHGWGANADLFAQTIDFLSGAYHVAAPDLPGFGKSQEPVEPYDLNDYVDFAAAFTNHVIRLKNECQSCGRMDTESAGDNLQAKSKSVQGNDAAGDREPEVIFLGHSHGGRVILRLLARAAANEAADGIGEGFGFHVNKAILTDSAGIVPEKTQAQKKRTARYKRYKTLLTKTGLTKMAPWLMDRLQKKYGSADYAAASPVMRQSMVKVVNTDLRAEMPSIRIPVLLIWGDADTATPLSDGKEMERLMPEAGLAIIPGGTHFCFLENPILYHRILGSFLGM